MFVTDSLTYLESPSNIFTSKITMIMCDSVQIWETHEQSGFTNYIVIQKKLLLHP